MTESNIVISKDGKTIPEFQMNASKLLDKTIVIYGKSNSGKTVIVKNILKILKNYIPIPFVISPTEPANRSYEHFIDKTLIHYDLGLEKKDEAFLEKLWEWQTMRASIYNKVNKPAVIRSLYNRIRTDEDDKIIRQIEGKKKTAIESSAFGKHDEVDKIYTELITKYLQKKISLKKTTLHRYKDNLNDDELYSLNYIDMNPRIVLIFDDCAAEFKQCFNRPVFKRLFYQGRHSYITSIFCNQDDTDLPANLRKNVSINIFTQPAVAKANFERGSNKYSKDMIKKAENLYEEVFIGYRKLIFIDNDSNKNMFYHYTAKIVEPFKFGSTSLNSLCYADATEEGSIDKQNKYYSIFKIQNKK